MAIAVKKTLAKVINALLLVYTIARKGKTFQLGLI